MARVARDRPGAVRRHDVAPDAVELEPHLALEHLPEAAGRRFGERGYDGTRLDDVAADAGVTKPILYRHFADKERLRAVLEVWLTYVETHAYAWRMLFRDTGGGPAVQAFRIEVHARARAVLAGMIGAFAPERYP